MSFSPAKRMRRVEIEFPAELVEEVTRTLVYSGVFQIEDSSAFSMNRPGKALANASEQTARLNRLEAELSALLGQLDLNISASELDLNAEREGQSLEALEATLKPIAEQLLALQTQVEVLPPLLEQSENYLKIIAPFTDLEVEFSAIRNRRYLYSILGSMPADRIPRFKESLSSIPFALMELTREDNLSTVLLLGPKSQQDFLNYTARSAYLNEVDLPDEMGGTPAQVTADLRRQIAELEEQSAHLAKQKKALAEQYGAQLKQIFFRVRKERLLLNVTSHYARLKKDFLVVGWVPDKDASRLAGDLMALGSEVIVDFPAEEGEEDQHKAPVLMKHSRFLQGFEKLVTTYSIPDNRELDPTVLILITFPLLFGAMFGDVGQGLVMALAGLVLMSGKIKKLGKLAKLGPVAVFSGISAMIFGFLYGSVFAMEDILEPIWVRPIEKIMNLLLVTFGAGAVLLSIANVLSMINDARRRDWGHMIFSGKGLAGLLLYWALLGVVIQGFIPGLAPLHNVFYIMALVCVLMIMASGFVERLIAGKRPLFEGGFFVYFIQSFFELFETLIGYLSNSLSYVRVGAFAVAHAGLSEVFVLLANMVSPHRGFAFYLVMVFGNIFIIGFEGMIVSIQTLRLEYYEFFSKFFKGGGKRYQPLTVKSITKSGVIK